MKRTAIIIMFLGIYLALGFSHHVLAENGTGEEPILDFASAALQNQEQLCGASLEVEYASEWRKFGAGSSVVAQESQNCRYTRTSDVFRIEKTKEQGDKEISSYNRLTSERRVFIEIHGRRAGEIGQVGNEPNSVLDLLDPVHYPLYEGPLYQRIKFGNITASADPVDGYPCIRAEIPTERSTLNKYIVWVDQSIGFNPRRIEFVWKDKQPTVVSFTDYRDVGNGVWLPHKQTLSYGSRAMKDNTFSVINTVSAVTKGRTLPASEVVVQFPPGTDVYDATLDARYTTN